MKTQVLQAAIAAGLLVGGAAAEAGPYDWRPGYDSYNSWRGNSYDNYPRNRNGYSYHAPRNYVRPYYKPGYVPYNTYYGPQFGVQPYYYGRQPYFQYQYQYQYRYGY